jgi:hypothetical protein
LQQFSGQLYQSKLSQDVSVGEETVTRIASQKGHELLVLLFGDLVDLGNVRVRQHLHLQRRGTCLALNPPLMSLNPPPVCLNPLPMCLNPPPMCLSYLYHTRVDLYHTMGIAHNQTRSKRGAIALQKGAKCGPIGGQMWSKRR